VTKFIRDSFTNLRQQFINLTKNERTELQLSPERLTTYYKKRNKRSKRFIKIFTKIQRPAFYANTSYANYPIHYNLLVLPKDLNIYKCAGYL
jgi:hypothetical protein